MRNVYGQDCQRLHEEGSMETLSEIIETMDLPAEDLETDLSGSLDNPNLLEYTYTKNEVDELRITQIYTREGSVAVATVIVQRYEKLAVNFIVAKVLGGMARKEAGVNFEVGKGRIDILTNTSVIEVKVITRWREAVMQIGEYWRAKHNEKKELQMALVYVCYQTMHREMCQRVRNAVDSILVCSASAGTEGSPVLLKIRVYFAVITWLECGGCDMKLFREFEIPEG
ncbi:hypothetical protein HK097_002356 [Rhizophlyctis rosea]|uniref:Uncharacterized protein n=1 Tax=Rhizophlyctis rosea TaxID=64517 RepID=A0AAD5SGZ5_9FUNG|nr:hypothetical protein HK097_002356 [Rhizophlyctis rosea]